MMLRPISSAVPLEPGIGGANDTRMYFVAPSTTQGSALAQARISEYASQNDVTVESTQIQPALKVEPFHRLRLTVHVSGNLKSTLGYIRALETSDPPLFPTNLDMKRVSDASIASMDEQIPLRMSITVDAYLLEGQPE